MDSNSYRISCSDHGYYTGFVPGMKGKVKIGLSILTLGIVPLVRLIAFKRRLKRAEKIRIDIILAYSQSKIGFQKYKRLVKEANAKIKEINQEYNNNENKSI